MFRRLLHRARSAPATWVHRLPSQCAVCHSWPSQPLCEACIARFAQPVARCQTCAIALPPLPSPPALHTDARQCGRCLREPPPLRACLAAVSYGYPWAQVLAQFKFQARPGWAHGLATLMRSTPWVDPALDQADWVVPLPLSPERLRNRGFNQSLQLARALAPARAHAGLLLRVRDTPAQHALPRAQRLANVRGAFAAEPLAAALLRDARVVLVDDIMTTGATLFAAALALRDAGAAQVTGLVVARTEAPAPSG